MACCASCAANLPCESGCPAHGHEHGHGAAVLGMPPDLAAQLSAPVMGADQSQILDSPNLLSVYRAIPRVYPEVSIVGMSPEAVSACLAGSCARARERQAMLGVAIGRQPAGKGGGSAGRVVVRTPGKTRLPAAPTRPAARVDGRWQSGKRPPGKPAPGTAYESRKVGKADEWRLVPTADAPPPPAWVAPPPGLSCTGPWRRDGAPKPSNYQQIGAWWRACYPFDAPSYNVSDDDGAFLDQVSALLASLSQLPDAQLAQVLALNPWIPQFLAELGLLPQYADDAAGAQFWAAADSYADTGSAVLGFDLSDFRKADDAFSSVWDSVKTFVPYGNVIDEAHKARRGLMYGNTAAPKTTQVNPKDAAVKRMQGLWRRRWKGDRGADAEIVKLKERAAAGDPVAAREWALYVIVSSDDLARVPS